MILIQNFCTDKDVFWNVLWRVAASNECTCAYIPVTYLSFLKLRSYPHLLRQMSKTWHLYIEIKKDIACGDLLLNFRTVVSDQGFPFVVRNEPSALWSFAVGQTVRVVVGSVPRAASSDQLCQEQHPAHLCWTSGVWPTSAGGAVGISKEVEFLS